MKVSRSGPGLQALADRLKKAGYVKVGVVGPESRADHDGINMAALAAIHEYGAPSVGIPERAPIRSSIALHRSEYRKMIASMVKRILANKLSTKAALELLGMRAAADVQRFIADGLALPANTPEVFMRKLLKGQRGFNKTGAAPVPLIDQGLLRAAYTYEVTDGR